MASPFLGCRAICERGEGGPLSGSLAQRAARAVARTLGVQGAPVTCRALLLVPMCGFNADDVVEGVEMGPRTRPVTAAPPGVDGAPAALPRGLCVAHRKCRGWWRKRRTGTSAQRTLTVAPARMPGRALRVVAAKRLLAAGRDANALDLSRASTALRSPPHSVMNSLSGMDRIFLGIFIISTPKLLLMDDTMRLASARSSAHLASTAQGATGAARDPTPVRLNQRTNDHALSIFSSSSFNFTSSSSLRVAGFISAACEAAIAAHCGNRYPQPAARPRCWAAPARVASKQQQGIGRLSKCAQLSRVCATPLFVRQASACPPWPPRLRSTTRQAGLWPAHLRQRTGLQCLSPQGRRRHGRQVAPHV